MMTGCTVVVYQPSLCRVLSLRHSGEVTVQEVHRTSMESPIEGNQGESQGWQSIVTLSYLECSLCYVFQHDRCNPGHPI
jgi:hypothetical protein